MVGGRFCCKKNKNTAPWTYDIIYLNGEPITGSFYEKELKKPNEKEFRIEQVIKKKVISRMSNGKDTIIHLTVGLIKKTLNEILKSINYTLTN